MDATHIHLLLNHLPILGTIIGSVLLAYGLVRQQADVQKASLGLLVVAGLMAIPVYLTGESAEHTIEDLLQNVDAFIEPHEEAGSVALWAGIATGVFALIALILAATRERLVRWTVLLTLLVGLATSGVMGWTAYLGGQINHPEIRPTSTATPPPASTLEREEIREQ